MESNGKAKPKEGNEGTNGGSSPNGSKAHTSSSQTPYFKKDLYSDLQKIEDRGKRKKGFSIFGRDKK